VYQQWLQPRPYCPLQAFTQMRAVPAQRLMQARCALAEHDRLHALSFSAQCPVHWVAAIADPKLPQDSVDVRGQGSAEDSTQNSTRITGSILLIFRPPDARTDPISSE